MVRMCLLTVGWCLVSRRTSQRSVLCHWPRPPPREVLRLAPPAGAIRVAVAAIELVRFGLGISGLLVGRIQQNSGRACPRRWINDGPAHSGASSLHCRDLAGVIVVTGPRVERAIGTDSAGICELHSTAGGHFSRAVTGDESDNPIRTIPAATAVDPGPHGISGGAARRGLGRAPLCAVGRVRPGDRPHPSQPRW